jgi:hypothetical protein
MRFISKIRLQKLITHHQHTYMGLGFIPHCAFSQIGKDDGLVETIQVVKKKCKLCASTMNKK